MFRWISTFCSMAMRNCTKASGSVIIFRVLSATSKRRMLRDNDFGTEKRKRETRIWYVDLQYRIRVFCCKIEFYHSSFFQRLLHVDDALVAAAPEEEVFIAQCLYEGAVYQYIDLAEEFQLLGILHEVFEEIARKAPDALAALLPDGACQLGKAFA